MKKREELGRRWFSAEYLIPRRSAGGEGESKGSLHLLNPLRKIRRISSLLLGLSLQKLSQVALHAV